ncbi:MAG TPA: hypothetical protein VGO50_18280 [Pyrinomonadaceae bacterium]|jgi:hypothetical protein|nr:hypothetical protein [Pyrinomonadaceae bacterium]
MNEYLLPLIQKYKQKGILIDTNIFLLYIVGSLDISLVPEFKRTSDFSESDFEKVSKFIDFFDVKITTPNILTEVSNLIGKKPELRAALGIYITKLNEIFIESAKVSEHNAFIEFGLTDTAILNISKDSFLVVTDDRPLYGYLTTLKLKR